MKIIGVGVDIVAVARVQTLLDRYGARFAERVLSAEELQRYASSPRPAAFVAKRFAAKEAVSKALGTGFRDGMRLADIGVANDSLGRPLVRVTGRTAALAEALGVTDWHISLADETAYAIAYVTAVAN